MRYGLTTVAIWLIGAAAALAVEIEVARAAAVDYSAYRTFACRAKEGVPEGHPLGAKGQLFKEVSEAASETLLARGMTLAGGDAPDVWVTFFGLTEEELTIEGTTRKLGEGVKWIGDPGAHSSRTVLHATLIVEIYAADSGERIWSGWATGNAQNPEKVHRRAAKLTRKILEEFPRE